MSRKKVIQLGGSVRSGTTITGLILANRPNAIMLGEVMHLFKPYHQLHYTKINELQSDKRWSKILSDGASLLYENIFQMFSNIHLIIDSSKDPFWFKHLCEVNRDIDIDICQIITFKSPNGLMHSFKKRDLVNYETVYVNYYRRFFTLFSECRTIYTEQHLNNDSLLGDLQAYLNLELEPKALEYWNRTHPNFFGSQTVKKQSIHIEDSQNKAASFSDQVHNMFDFLKAREYRRQELVTMTKNIQYDSISIFLFKIKNFHLKKYFY